MIYNIYAKSINQNDKLINRADPSFAPNSNIAIYQMTKSAWGPFKCSVGMYGPVQISLTKVYGPTLLALRGGGWVSNLLGKKRYT